MQSCEVKGPEDTFIAQVLVKSFSYIDNALTDLRLCFTTTNAKRVGLARQVPKMEKPAQSAHYMSITHIKQQRLVLNVHYNLLRMLWDRSLVKIVPAEKSFTP